MRTRYLSGTPAASRRVWRGHLIGYLYVLPAAALFAIFVLYPLTQGFWISLFDWDGISPATWVGVGNYIDILGDPVLRDAFLHSVVLLFFFSVLPIALGLLAAAVLSTSRLRGATWYRMILFLPQVLPVVAIGVVWRWIYAPDGPLNQSLTAVGLGAFATGWLGDFTWALPAVGAIGTWIIFGFTMVLFLSGVQQISTDLYDAAKVDGAGRWQEFWAVTVPGLRNQLVVAVSITMIAAFRSFDIIYTTTGGGPGTATTVPAWQIYRRAFFYGEVGSSAAVGMALAG